MKILENELIQYFINEYYIRLQTDSSIKNTLMVYINNPSSKIYNMYISYIKKYLFNEMIFEYYEINGDKKGIIKIYKK